MPSWVKRALGLKPPKSGKYAPKPGEWGFLHSVGSFDPMPDRVLLWTRLTPPPALVEKHGLDGVAMEVSWEVSEAEDFGALVAAGAVTARAERDFCVTVDAAGLRPGTRYHYRFRWGSATSPAGRTKTAAEGPTEEVNFAVMSCANWWVRRAARARCGGSCTATGLPLPYFIAALSSEQTR